MQTPVKLSKYLKRDLQEKITANKLIKGLYCLILWNCKLQHQDPPAHALVALINAQRDFTNSCWWTCRPMGGGGLPSGAGTWSSHCARQLSGFLQN